MSNTMGGKSPGRPRKFDEDEVLQRATIAFLEGGFEAISYGQVANAMGLSKPSLYNTFGDKLALFERILEGYSKQARGFILSSFEGGNSLEDATEILLCSAADFYSRPNDYSLGCLLIGTALPATTQHESIRETLADFINSVEQSLEEVVTEKYSADVKRLDRTPRVIAVHIMSLISALAVRARMGLPRRKLTAHAKELASLLR